jgi:hypothetical protein
MNLWEYIGKTQKVFKNTPAAQITSPNSTRIPFSTAFDIASNLPQNPGGWDNDDLEKVRQVALNTVSKANPALVGGTVGLVLGGPVGAAVGAGSGLAIQQIDEATDGGATKVLQAGQKNFRSNYAFLRSVADENAAMGLLASLGFVAGGLAGGLAGFALGGPAGAFVGATAGAGLAGKGLRDTFETDLGASISKTLNKSAKFSESDVGQERYNLGRDVVHTAAQITGAQTLGDTSKGIGAISSGLVNFVAELGLGLDVAAAKGTGLAIKGTLRNPIVEPLTPFQKKIYGKSEAERVGARLAADVDLIKRTVAGEETVYTPVIKFIRENDAATVANRSGFESGSGKLAASLMAKESDETIGLVIRVGRGDPEAIAELALKRADKFAEYTRLDDAMQYVNNNGLFSLQFKGQTLVLSKRFKNNVALLDAEVEALKKEVGWLDDALSIQGDLTNRTVSKWAMVEKVRNDFAKENASRKLALDDNIQMETTLGKTYQWFYQKSPLSRPIRGLDRLTDDAPRQVINYNEPFAAGIRMQTSLRSAEKYGASIPQENARIFDNWMKARTENEKTAVIDNYVDTGMKLIGDKYNVGVDIIQFAIDKYNMTHKRFRDEAIKARELKQGYMNDPNDLDGPLIADAQLITQLANGAILPDWKFVDSVLNDFSKRNGETTKIIRSKEGAMYLADELNSLWRTGTLLRTGYPINVIKDSYIRAWGDGAISGMMKYLAQDTIDAIASSTNTVNRVNRWVKSTVNPNYNMKSIRKDIASRQLVLNEYDKSLAKAKYDVNNPPKTIPVALIPDIQRRNDVANSIAALRAQEQRLVSGVKIKPVRDRKVELDGEEFESAFGGRFGSIFKQKIDQKDDLRAAVAGVRELEVDISRRGRSGSASILPTDETRHMQSWVQILNDKLRFDPVAEMIMKGASKKVVLDWFRKGSPEAVAYLDRFSSNLRDAPVAYQRAKVMVDMYAPSQALRDLVVTDKLNLLELKKLYPDIQTRPPVFTDLVEDMVGNSSISKNFRQATKDMVVWLATQPTARLAFNPYFKAKYEQSLQTQIWLANANGTKLTLKKKSEFEAKARGFAQREYEEKLNSFHRDMNYSGWINYVFAFFPAVVEQFRAYARITIENPNFLVQKMAISTIPERLGEVEEDSAGNRYIPVNLGFLGLESRLPVEWFNPDNPTGGNILSVSPMGAALINEYAKQTQTENFFTDALLPFGVQRNSLNALNVNTARRLYQVWQAGVLKNGEQFNKDVDMFRQQLWNDYVKETGDKPSAKKWEQQFEEAKKRAFYLSVLRTVSAYTLPVQGRLVTSVTGYVDILNKYQDKYGAQGAEMFSIDYPDAWMFMDRLSDSTSGINSDRTSAALVVNNKPSIQKIVAGIGSENLTVLGAIFNNDDYAFSSAAQAVLQDTRIPGAGNKKFRDVSDAFENGRSALVSKGWKDYFTVEQVLKDEFARVTPAINPYKGYGAAVLKQYKQAFVDAAKVDNNLWWQEYNAQAAGGTGSRQADTVTALTIALNDEKLGPLLLKQPKFHAVADYLNYRRYVNSMLQRMGTTFDSQKATQLRTQVMLNVAELRASDINFDKLYTRYFENDKFDFVYEEPGD